MQKIKVLGWVSQSLGTPVVGEPNPTDCLFTALLSQVLRYADSKSPLTEGFPRNQFILEDGIKILNIKPGKISSS